MGRLDSLLVLFCSVCGKQWAKCDASGKTGSRAQIYDSACNMENLIRKSVWNIVDKLLLVRCRRRTIEDRIIQYAPPSLAATGGIGWPFFVSSILIMIWNINFKLPDCARMPQSRRHCFTPRRMEQYRNMHNFPAKSFDLVYMLIVCFSSLWFDLREILCFILFALSGKVNAKRRTSIIGFAV